MGIMVGKIPFPNPCRIRARGSVREREARCADVQGITWKLPRVGAPGPYVSVWFRVEHSPAKRDVKGKGPLFRERVHAMYPKVSRPQVPLSVRPSSLGRGETCEVPVGKGTKYACQTSSLHASGS